MATLGETIERIRNDVNRGSSHDTRIRQAIVDAIKFYRSHRFAWNQKRASTAIQPGDEFIDIPDDWREVDYLNGEHDGRKWPVREVTYDWIEERQSGSVTGEPRQFAIQNRKLRLYPTPDQSYSLAMSFLYELREVSVSASDAATNAWLDEGEELIRKHALADLYVTYFRGETIAEGKSLRAEVDGQLVPNLQAAAAREQSSGRIKPFL